MSTTYVQPCLYIGHGGGPMPLMGRQDNVVSSLRQHVSSLPTKPAGIAHWTTTSGFTVSSAPRHSLLFDYGGFPKETYEYSYDAPGSPDLASRIISLCNQAGVECKGDDKRGWDHGVFVPLMLMFPDADVPIVSMSLSSGYDPEFHFNTGRAIAHLRSENILILGSGSSFHNFDYLFTRNATKKVEGILLAHQFDDWLRETVTSSELSPTERLQRLKNWSSAPGGVASHPLGQEEHLAPLFVICGAADGNAGENGYNVNSEDSFPFSDFKWA